MMVEWEHGAEHMWHRHRVRAVEADEVVGDVDAVWFDPDPAGKSGLGVRVIGYSRTRRQVLTVILVHREGGGFFGANGWASNSSDRRRYEEGQ